MTRLFKSQSGDTIVEVLIAVAVVSLVLTGAFAIANASLKQIRMSEERAEAQKVASGLVEELPHVVKKYGLVASTDSMTTSGFCENKSTNTLVSVPNAVCNSGTDNRYRGTIRRIYGVNTTYFEVNVSWDGLNNAVERITYTYKVNE